MDFKKVSKEAQTKVQSKECISAPIGCKSLVFKHIKEQAKSLVASVRNHRTGANQWDKVAHTYLERAYYLATFLDDNHPIVEEMLYAIEVKNDSYKAQSSRLKPMVKTKVIKDVQERKTQNRGKAEGSNQQATNTKRAITADK